MISYIYSAEEIKSEHLRGFFEGWPNPPGPETHLLILKQSHEIVLALDNDTGQVVGFVNAISDGVLAAYIPLLEVLPKYRKQGIGSELMERMLDRLRNYYMIDLVCDPEMEQFYSRFKLNKGTAMMIRNFDRQSGSPDVY